MPRPFAIGRLRHVVTVLRPDGPGATRTASNQPVPDWAPLKTFRADLEETAGRETWVAQQVQGEVSHVFAGRYDADLHARGTNYRLVHAGRVFEVVAATDPESRGRHMLVFCLEVKGETWPAP